MRCGNMWQCEARLLTDTSVKYQPTIGEVSAKCRQSVGEVSAKCRRSVGEVSAKCWRSVGEVSANEKLYRPRHIWNDYRPCLDRVSTDYRPTIDRYIDRVSTECRPSIDRVSTKYRPTIDRLSTDCRPSIDRLSTDYRPLYRPLYRPMSRSTLPTVNKIRTTLPGRRRGLFLSLAWGEGRRFVVIDCKVDVFCMCDFWEMTDKPLFSKMFIYDNVKPNCTCQFCNFSALFKKIIRLW